MKPGDLRRHRHRFYEAAVQNVEVDIDFVERVYRRLNGRLPGTLREDFCGTASLASAFAARRPDNRAWGVDLHRPTLDWGWRNRVEARCVEDSVELECRDVRLAPGPAVDVQVAFNFSFFLFPGRGEMLDYFRAARRSLEPGGLFVLDAFGGTDSFQATTEDTEIEASVGVDGIALPAFTYSWDQLAFNAVDHWMRCAMHFTPEGGEKVRNVFRYAWRMWTLPEIRELLAEAGFDDVEVYGEGWDAGTGEGNGIFRRRTRMANEGSWVVYLVARY
ncbi:MAG: methyltransferase domain-containing protein [Acidobacteriota bacterium]|nr:methyltransferase domain-containing protein [Acidobacteriota bacterium]